MSAVLALTLAGCEETVDLTLPAAARAGHIKSEPSITAIQVAERKDMHTLTAELGATLPTPIAEISRRLIEVLCVANKKGREVCEDVKLTGSVAAEGRPTIEAQGLRIMLAFPLRYDVSARVYGSSAGTLFTRTGLLTVRAPLQVTVNEQWQLGLTYDGSLAWSEPPSFAVLKGTASIERDVADVVMPRIRKLTSSLAALLQPVRLKSITAGAWRHLHYPIELSERPSLWLRGEPMEVRFAGLASTAATIELRTVIVTRLSILRGDRPAPLMPRPVPQLTMGELVGDSGPLLPVDLNFDRIAAQIARNLPSDMPIASDPGAQTALTYRVADLQASGTRLAVTMELDAKLPEIWRSVRCRVTFLGDPVVAPGETVLRLVNASRMPDARIRSYAAPARDLLWQRRVSELLVRAIAFDAAPDMEATLALARSAIDVPMGDGLQLKGLFTGARTKSAVATDNGVRLNVEMLGELVVRAEHPEFAADDSKTSASAAGAPETAVP